MLLAIAASAQPDPTTDPDDPIGPAVPFGPVAPMPLPVGPVVELDLTSASLQASLYPDYYRTRLAASDLSWLRRNDTAWQTWWYAQRDTIVGTLIKLAGMSWSADTLRVQVLRYYPSPGSHDPLILPRGGVKRGPVIEVVPGGVGAMFHVTYLLARRLLTDVVRYGSASIDDGVRLHPLLRASPFRRDNLAMLLTMAVCDSLVGVDSTRAIYRSSFWRKYHPGRAQFEGLLLDQWQLTPGGTLAGWLSIEPYASELVRATNPPRRPTTDEQTIGADFAEIPVDGVLGIAVRQEGNGGLVVSAVDPARVGGAAGLAPGDRFVFVDGQRPRTHRQLIDYLLTGYDNGAARVTIEREGERQTLYLFPQFIGPQPPVPAGPAAPFFPNLDQ